MRKKEPPSPAMPAQQGCGPPLSQAAYTEALGRKREALDREVAAFTARKEEEFRAYERRLSVSATAPENLELSRKEERVNGFNDDSTRGAQSTGPVGSNFENVHDTIQPSPITPLHDKERELQGLFLPHFIPLLDDPPVKRSTSPLKRPSSSELPAQRTQVTSPDPSAYSPRTSPSPTLLASPPPAESPAPESIDKLLAPTEFGSRSATPTPSNTSSSNSEPVSPTAIPPHLRPSSQSSSSSHRQNDTEFQTLLSPQLQPERPAIGTRTSSTQSDASTTSLKSSLRRPTAHHARLGSHHKKKHVRISIGNLAVAPSESPVQTRSAFRPPSYSQTSNFALPAADDKDSGLADERGRVEARDVKAGKARIDDEGGARRRRKKRAPTISTSTSSSKQKEKVLVDESLDYFPPQPLRSPSLPNHPISPSISKPNGRYAGTDLIQPTTPTTPPAFMEREEEEFADVDDPLFGGGKESPRQGPQDDEMFRDDMEVVNGHDLVEDEEEDEGLALPSPSPHASSMPMAIRSNSSSGWQRMGMVMGRGLAKGP